LPESGGDGDQRGPLLGLPDRSGGDEPALVNDDDIVGKLFDLSKRMWVVIVFAPQSKPA
jgi:hypothetical protein